MKNRSPLGIALGATALLGLGCVTADISGAGVPRNMSEGQKALQKAKKFKDVRDAWKDAIENISPDDERAIGSAAAVQLIAQSPGGLMLDDRDLLDYVNDVGSTVALAWQPAKRKNGRPRSLARRIFVGILSDDATVNAFSTPGGNILVTTGLLRRLDSESELAFVLAHEIAHIDHEDGLVALKGARGLPAAVEEYFQGSGQNSLAGLFLQQPLFNAVAEKVVDDIVANFGLYSRLQESAADATGLDYLSDAGYDCTAPGRVLGVLAEARAANPVPDDGSHGTPEQRLGDLKKKMKSGGKVGFERYQEKAIQRLERVQGTQPTP